MRFFDAEAGEFLGDHDMDAHGAEPVGADADGFWWGTERAAWTLPSAEDGRKDARVVELHGHLAGEPYVGFFLGRVAEAMAYARSHGVSVARTEARRVRRVRAY